MMTTTIVRMHSLVRVTGNIESTGRFRLSHFPDQVLVQVFQQYSLSMPIYQFKHLDQYLYTVVVEYLW